MRARATKKKLKKKSMKGIKDDFVLGNWIRWLKYKRGEL